MNTTLSVLEMRMLLKCSKELVSHSKMSNVYAKRTLQVRQDALNHLIQQQYIVARELPHSPQGKPPVFYEITEKGRTWVDAYLQEVPPAKKIKFHEQGGYLIGIDLKTMEIRILLKCYEGLLPHPYFTVLYIKRPSTERKAAINHLKEKQYLVAREFPLPVRGEAPVFYEITGKGEAWIESYLQQVAPGKKIKDSGKKRHAIPLDLNTLAIRMLLQCYNKDKNKELLHHARFAVVYCRYPLSERKEAIDHLIQKRYVTAIKLPTPGPGQRPVYYEITETGRAWVKYYLDNHPGEKK